MFVREFSWLLDDLICTTRRTIVAILFDSVFICVTNLIDFMFVFRVNYFFRVCKQIGKYNENKTFMIENNLLQSKEKTKMDRILLTERLDVIFSEGARLLKYDSKIILENFTLKRFRVRVEAIPKID